MPLLSPNQHFKHSKQGAPSFSTLIFHDFSNIKKMKIHHSSDSECGVFDIASDFKFMPFILHALLPEARQAHDLG